MGFFSFEETQTKIVGTCLWCKKPIKGEVSVKTGKITDVELGYLLQDGALICLDCVDTRELSHSEVSKTTQAGLIAMYKSKGLMGPNDFMPSKRVMDESRHLFLEVDETRKLINIPSTQFGWISNDYCDNVFPYSKILDFKVIDNGKQILEGGSMLRTAVGGLAFGGSGAIVASLLPSRQLTNKCQELALKVVVDDLQVNNVFIYFVGDKSLHARFEADRDTEFYRHTVELLEECVSILTIIMKRNQANNMPDGGASAMDSQEQPSNDVIGNIKKLAELKEAGIISQEEFEAKKAELLARI